jgi:ferritin-like metal-binding protein YciE
MAQENLHDLFVHELKDIYSAENQILKALPKMVEAANSAELEKAFSDHLHQTEGHVQRIEEIFRQLEDSPRGKKCVGMEGLVEEGKEVLKEEAEDWVKDAALIGAAQKVEHYEMAAYGTARAHAEKLGMSRAADLLQQTLKEEEAADKKLTDIAESAVNTLAAA